MKFLLLLARAFAKSVGNENATVTINGNYYLAQFAHNSETDVIKDYNLHLVNCSDNKLSTIYSNASHSTCVACFPTKPKTGNFTSKTEIGNETKKQLDHCFVSKQGFKNADSCFTFRNKKQEK